MAKRELVLTIRERRGGSDSTKALEDAPEENYRRLLSRNEKTIDSEKEFKTCLKSLM